MISLQNLTSRAKWNDVVFSGRKFVLAHAFVCPLALEFERFVDGAIEFALDLGRLGEV
jgi:hypothetical protein